MGGRATPFDGPPYAVYVPLGHTYLLEALVDAVEVAIGTAPVVASAPSATSSWRTSRRTVDPPRETSLEELYYHRLRRPDGYALQRVYTRDGSLDVTVAVRDGDCVLVPRGYHPVSAAPGFELYYLNVMAGPLRQWRVTFDSVVEQALG